MADHDFLALWPRRLSLLPLAQRRGRGFSLVELMIVVAVSSILIATSVAVFTAMLNQKRRAERTLEVHSAIRMSSGVIDFDAANAGFRFPASAFAVRFRQNVTAFTTLNVNGVDATAGLITSNANCGRASWGLKEGTDVLELAQGFETEAAGTVSAVDTPWTSFRMNATQPLSVVAPGQNPVVLFARNGNACLARVTSGPAAASLPISITMLAPDYTVEGNPANRYPFCPQANMSVYRLGQRIRYMVCVDPAAVAPATQRGELFRQVSDGDGFFSAVGTANFQAVQDGIADLQVGVRIRDRTWGGINGAANACSNIGAARFCYCHVEAPCTGMDLNGRTPDFNSDITTNSSHEQWVRNLVIGLVAVSPRVMESGPVALEATFRRPGLMDRPAPTGNGDGNLYLSIQHNVPLNNITMVQP